MALGSTLPPTPPMDRNPEPPSAPFNFGQQRARSPHFIAEKTAEMICYLWFSTTLGRAPMPSPKSPMPRTRQRRHRAHQPSPPSSSPPDATRTALQFQPTASFVQFLLKVLETTQVSQSVIVLSLHYVFRLKEQNYMTHGQPGSELRVAVVALMMANKFVDDNTYTNKTWSEVSGIDLTEINKMEREFLAGVDYRLFVDKATYDSWLHLLKGLVAAKETEYRLWQKRSQLRIAQAAPRPHAMHATAARPPRQPANLLHTPQRTQRARSTSPLPSARSPSYPFTFVAPPQDSNPFLHSRTPPLPTHMAQDYYISAARQSPHMPPKRPARDAFSPPSFAAHARLHPPKRPVSLDMSAVPRSHPMFASFRDPDVDRDMDMDTAPVSHGNSQAVSPALTYSALPPLAIPTVELTSFSQLSISGPRPNSPPLSAYPPPNRHSSATAATTPSLAHPSQVLAAPFRHKAHKSSEPQALYFYTLASSPLGDQHEKFTSRERKGRLRYHESSQYAPPHAPFHDTSYAVTGSAHAELRAESYLRPSPARRYNAAPQRLSVSAHPSPASMHHPSRVVLPPLAHVPPAKFIQLPQLQIPRHTHAMLSPPPSGTSVVAPLSQVHVLHAPFANAGSPAVRVPRIMGSGGGARPYHHAQWEYPPRMQPV